MSNDEQANERSTIDSGQTGAQINQTYIKRTQKCIAVNKSDLEENLTFGALESCLKGFGLFFLSGALWLGIEEVFEILAIEDWIFTPTILFCALAAIFGAVLLGCGVVVGSLRKKKITAIFNETEVD